MAILDGKAIIITGAGRGIGAAYAHSLAAMGGAVVVNDIDADQARACAEAIADSGGRAIAHEADISSWPAAKSLVEDCLDNFGTVDGLVNNAGVFEMGRLDETHEGHVERLVRVNLVGTANCAAHAVKVMLRQKSGSIVNVTSGAQMGIPAMGAYGATKGAIASFTYAWAKELEGTGVRVNAVSPLAMSRMVDITGEYFEEHGRARPPKPEVSAESNAPLVAYLLSDEASEIHGQVVRIEGEQLALVAHPAVLLPVLEREGGWSFETIKEAFASGLAKRQVPLGIIGAEITGFGAPSRFWKRDRD